MRRRRKLADGHEACACSYMPVHSNEPVGAADCPAAERLLLTIGRAGVLSCRTIAAGELETLLPSSVRRQKVSTAISDWRPTSSWSRTAN